MSEDNFVHLPIDGTLDLHAFRPSDIKHLVPDYLEECRGKGIYHVRIIHGKGIGNLRRTVHAALDRLDYVASYRLAGEDAGSWGATLVDLKPVR
ncbi:MAG: Smr/MutS family protein [Desulfobulbaceae bacterium]|nr:Smr/MutS family protein [Desulfobulbaceae bacterium]